ncbi:hypothetical protein HRH25_15570 [Flavisolibacter sp. BT320]|nr:hypothetical protein [Flavisolibacter longurius]
MYKKIGGAALLSLFLLKGFAQQANGDRIAPKAMVASAKGDDSYIAFSVDSYKPEKKYTVFSVWKDDAPPSETEKATLYQLKEALAKKGVELKLVEWKIEEDLKAAFAPYKIDVSTKDGKHIRLKTGSAQLNTTAAKALYVVENGQPVSLCSGMACEDKLRYFFGLKAFN